MPSPSSSTSSSPAVTDANNASTSSSTAAADLPTTFQIDYELTNKKIRQYAVADVGTVRLALSEHMSEFLTYHKVPIYHGYEYARWFFGFVIIFAGFGSYIFRYEKFLDNRPIFFASAIIFGICTLIELYIAKYVEGPDTFLISKPFAKAKASSSKASGKASLLSSSPADIVKAYDSRMPTPEEQAKEDSLVIAKMEEEAAAKEAKKNGGKKKAAEEEMKKKEEAEAAEGTEEEKNGEEEDDETAAAPVVRLHPPAAPSDYATYVVPRKEGSIYSSDLKTYCANRHIRLRLEMNEALPCFKLFADVLDSATVTRFWSSPRVVVTVVNDLPFASFFDAEGYVHPPAIKTHVMKILKELDAAATAQQQAESKKRK